jgi:hypothetical protein
MLAVTVRNKTNLGNSVRMPGSLATLDTVALIILVGKDPGVRWPQRATSVPQGSVGHHSVCTPSRQVVHSLDGQSRGPGQWRCPSGQSVNSSARVPRHPRRPQLL